MRKLFALALALLLTGSMAIAQTGGDKTSAAAKGKKAATKSADTDKDKGKKGHKGGKKSTDLNPQPLPPGAKTPTKGTPQ